MPSIYLEVTPGVRYTLQREGAGDRRRYPRDGSRACPARGLAMNRLVVARAAGGLVGFRLQDVEEVMRPLPLEPPIGGPTFLRGTSVIRGEAVPVVDLRTLLGREDTASPARWMVVWAGRRRVALAVDAVTGVKEPDALEPPAPLLATLGEDVVAAVARRDHELMLVLEAARLLADLPDEEGA